MTDLYQTAQDREKTHVPSAVWGILKLPKNTAQKTNRTKAGPVDEKDWSKTHPRKLE